MKTSIMGLGGLGMILCVGVADAPRVANAASATSAFVGTWASTADTRLSNCSSSLPVSDVFGTTLTWSAGATGHIQTDFIGKCVLDAKVAGNLALAADQTCNDNGIQYTAGGTFTLLSDGSARLAEHVLVVANGKACSGTIDGVFKPFAP